MRKIIFNMACLGMIVVLLSSCGSGSMQASKTFRFKDTKLTVAAPSGWSFTPLNKGTEKWAPLEAIYFANKSPEKASKDNIDVNDSSFMWMTISESEWLDDDKKYDDKTAVKYNNVYVSLGEPSLNESDKIEDKANLNSWRNGYIYITKSKGYPIACLYRYKGNLPSEYEAIFNSIVIEEDK